MTLRSGLSATSLIAVAALAGLPIMAVGEPFLISRRMEREEEQFFHKPRPDNRGRRAEKQAIAAAKAARQKARRSQP